MSSVLKRKIGKFLIKISLFLWILDRLTDWVSTLVGEMICGTEYLCPVDGVVCDRSCGFNTDMHLSMLFVTLIILGIILLLSANKVRHLTDDGLNEGGE